MVQQTRVCKLSLADEVHQTGHRLILIKLYKEVGEAREGHSDPYILNHFNQLFIGSVGIERHKDVFDIGLERGRRLRIDQPAMDVLVQFHHVAEVLLELSEPPQVLPDHHILGGRHCL